MSMRKSSKTGLNPIPGQPYQALLALFVPCHSDPAGRQQTAMDTGSHQGLFRAWPPPNGRKAANRLLKFGPKFSYKFYYLYIIKARKIYSVTAAQKGKLAPFVPVSLLFPYRKEV